MTGTRLSMTQWVDHQELLPTTSDLWTHSMHSRCKEVYQSRHKMGVQQHLYQRRWQTQGCIHYKPRAVRTYGYVFWANQFPHHFSDNDECNLHQRNSRRMADCIYGWHSSGHQRWFGVPWEMCSSNARKFEKTWPLPQTREMCLWSEKNQVPRSDPQRQNHTNGPGKSQRRSRLATPTECHRYTLIPRIYRVLSLLYTELLTHCLAHDPTHMKERPIQLGPLLHPCVQASKVAHVCETNTMTTWLHKSLLLSNWCLCLQHGCHTLAGGRTKPKKPKTNAMSCCLLLKYIHADWMKLWHLWMRILRSSKSP